LLTRVVDFFSFRHTAVEEDGNRMDPALTVSSVRKRVRATLSKRTVSKNDPCPNQSTPGEVRAYPADVVPFVVLLSFFSLHYFLHAAGCLFGGWFFLVAPIAVKYAIPSLREQATRHT
jgi:hypothetical protein